jgi:antitoxin HicB
MTRYAYPVVIEPLEEGGYLASCPNLPGCHAEGRTRGEALSIIEDVMKIFIEDMIAENQELPPPVDTNSTVTILEYIGA